MANILDYLDWRGDLPFSFAPFNEVDNLILAKLSFLDFEGIVPPFAAGGSVALTEAAQLFFCRTQEASPDMGVLVSDLIPALLRKAAASRRFAGLRLCGYVNQLDIEKEQQFSAVTAEVGDGTVYVAFRGTDDTLVGWKEDFNMSFLPVIPSQRAAVPYLQQAAQAYPNTPLRVGGHSKGGNLAVYSAVHCGDAVQKRIHAVYNNDGPGFSSTLLGLAEHEKIAQRIMTIVPQSSVVGMLLEHEEAYQVVLSTQTGLWQHDGFSWEVLGDHFVHLDDVTREGRMVDETLKTLVQELTVEQRETFFDTLFDVLQSTQAHTLTDLRGEGLKSAAAMLRTVKEMDKETRKALSYTLKLLFKSGAQTIQENLRLSERLKELVHLPGVKELLDKSEE